MAKLLSEPGLMLDGECPDCGFPLYRTAYPNNEAEKKQLPCRVCALRAEVERLKAQLAGDGAEHQRLVDAVEEFLEIYEAEFTVGDLPTMMRELARRLG
jgi:uncharacterized Zn finger protein (UPF0148 family)